MNRDNTTVGYNTEFSTPSIFYTKITHFAPWPLDYRKKKLRNCYFFLNKHHLVLRKHTKNLGQKYTDFSQRTGKVLRTKI